MQSAKILYQRKHRNQISCPIEPIVQVAITYVPAEYRSHLSTHTDHHVAHRPLGTGTSILNLPDHVHSVDDLSKDNVFVVQKGGRSGGDEELRAIAVGAGVRHTQQTSCVVLESEVFVCKRLGTIDRSATGTVAVQKVAALYHEVGNHSMKSATFVSLWSTLRVLGLPGTELTEILGGFGGDVGEELHLDPAQRLPT